ncbi:MAG: response regulator, partial [Candidatus Poribacteria bacterium]|nr:response regulator [Candidatus Poribacteria bacterium]
MDVERSKKDTILIVDDTPMNLELLVNELTDAGFEVSVAMSGQIALRQLKYDHPDIILLDVLMPGMDGFETCRRLKASRKTKDIPVIFMTALADTADKVKGFNVGAVDYVTKPLQYEEVKARVKTHLMIQRLQKHLEEKNAHLQQEIIERKRVEEALQEANDKLEQRVAGRTADLKKANTELQAALFEVERLKNRLQVENVYLQEEIKLQHNFEEIISQSDAFKKVLHLVEQGASTD